MGDRVMVFFLGLVGVYLVAMNIRWVVEGGGWVPFSLAGVAAVTSLAAFRYAVRRRV